ncbi:MAG: flagellar hook-basal body complex protein FliE [Acidobacteria bacterium]|jgi:flagellar hook-basal body complex protein FliE|nr:flagellar hook-basal body complex protein FliE [Acidobacteriota bacterium]
MSTPLSTLGLLNPGTGAIGAPGTTGTGSAPAGAGGDFASTLKDMMGKVDASADAANDAVAKMIDGTGDVHEAMIALQHADVMLQMTVQVRNKLVQAYQDVMRMPV